MKFGKLSKYQVSCTPFNASNSVRSGKSGKHSETYGTDLQLDVMSIAKIRKHNFHLLNMKLI